MNRFSFLKYSVIGFSSLFFLTSCDKDFNEVGADIIGDSGFEFSSYSDATVTAYNQFDAVVQTNNLPINQLGIIDNAAFGTTISSFVTQVQLANLNPEFPNSAIVDKVELTIPYYSTQLTDDGTDKTYRLDSIYGTGKINLQIFRTNKFLRNFNEVLLPQRYFSDETSIFDSNINGTKLNDEAISENTEFAFSSSQQTEISLKSEDQSEVTTKVAPRMKLQLNKLFFQNLLINAKASGKLTTNALFQEYFRGLYFKVDAVNNEKGMALMNFAGGKITVFYKESTAGIRKTLAINLIGNTVNLFQNSLASNTLPINTVPVIATDRLYLKGGAGFHSYLDLFGTADATGVVPKEAIAELKNNNWIINEANLVFTIDQTIPSGEIPKRIYVYDAKNKRPVFDYVTDQSASTSKPKYSKVVHGGIYTEVKNTAGVIIAKRYKIRITDHIKNIINRDSTNVRLGVSVTEDISKIGNKYMKNTPDNAYFNSIPEASVINPLGTILYGSGANVEQSKRIKLEIFYTKPN